MGETRVGVWKSGVLEHISVNISETRKDRGKVTMEGLYQRSFERYNPRPVWPFLAQDWRFATPPKIPIAIISGIDEATNFKFGRNIHRVYPNKSTLKILTKREHGRIKFCTHILSRPIDRNKSPLQISGKEAVC